MKPLTVPAVRPKATGRVGDVKSGGGHGYIIRSGPAKSPLYAKGVTYEIGNEAREVTVLTIDYDDASWWRAYAPAQAWADRHLPRRRSHEVVRIQFPQTDEVRG